MITGYIAASLLALVLTASTRSHRILNLISSMHSLVWLAFSIMAVTRSPEADGFLMDGLSAYMMAIASTIFFLASLYSSGYLEGLINAGFLDRRNLRLFYGGLNSLLLVCSLAFFAGNLGLMWVFMELSTFIAAFLIATLNSKKNLDASLKYIFVTSTAMLFAFMGLLLLYAVAGSLEWAQLLGQAEGLPEVSLTVVFILLFIGFGAKAGMAPFHTALPHAYSKAPSAVSAIISAVMLNLGIYGILRIYALASRNAAFGHVSSLLIAFGALSLAVAAFSMLQQNNIKKLIAFSSVEHAGIMLVGLGLGTEAAVFWVLCHMLAHALTKALLFFSVGILQRQYLSSKAENIKDAFRLQPIASAGLILGSLAIAGIPPFFVFTTKLSILMETVGYSQALLFAVLLLLILAATSFARTLLDAFKNKAEDEIKQYTASSKMKAPIIFLVLILVALGLFLPESLIELISRISGVLI